MFDNCRYDLPQNTIYLYDTIVPLHPCLNHHPAWTVALGQSSPFLPKEVGRSVQYFLATRSCLHTMDPINYMVRIYFSEGGLWLTHADSC